MSKPTENEVKLEVVLQLAGFPRTLYFNRLRVDRDNGLTLVQFGLVVASDLIDSYSCILTDATLQQNQASLLDYIKKLGPDVAKDFAWKGVGATRKSDVADVVSMSFRGGDAEIIFSVYSICAASQIARAGSTASSSIPSQPLILLRSKMALQKELIAALYA